jgi:hypothetical protein
MDALKKMIQAIAAYKFWLLSAMVLLVSAGVFVMTELNLGALIASRVSKLDETFGQINTISGAVATHPNEFSHKELDKLVSVLEQEVKEAWELQYNRQQPLLVWPAKAFSGKNQTIEIFKNLRPIELHVDFPVASTTAPIGKITVNDREVYRRYIGPEFSEVSKIIGTEWKAKIEKTGMGGMGYGGEMAGGAAGMGLGGEMPGGMGGEGSYGGGSFGTDMSMSESKDLVRWSRESQQQLMQQILPWYSLREPPSVLDIYYAQEDMWLLTGIMEIIRATNAGAVENFQTKVREIEWIRMGRYANRDAGKLSVYNQMQGGMGMGGEGGMDMGMGMDMDMGMGGEGGMMGMGSEGSYGSSEPGSDAGGGMGGEMGMGGGMMPVIDPADNRYISFAADKEFEPVKGVDLREAIKNMSAQNAVDAVAKRVPIRMRLKIDPNHLNRLIAECGNANMMLEVYQIRLNTEAAPAAGMGMASSYGGGGGGKGAMGMGMGGESMDSGGGMGMGVGMEMGGDMGMGMGGEGSYGGYGGNPNIKPLSEIPVEIFGLIYLYNPVNTASLGSDKVTDAPIDQPAVPTETEAPKAAAPVVNATAPAANAGAQDPQSPASPEAPTPPVPPSENPAVPSEPLGTPPSNESVEKNQPSPTSTQ